jgi:hypothetical protein
MATVVLNIEVDDKNFKAVEERTKKFAELLGKSPAQVKNITTEEAKLAKSLDDVLKNLLKTIDSMKELADVVKDITKGTSETAKNVEKIDRSSKGGSKGGRVFGPVSGDRVNYGSGLYSGASAVVHGVTGAFGGQLGGIAGKTLTGAEKGAKWGAKFGGPIGAILGGVLGAGAGGTLATLVDAIEAGQWLGGAPGAKAFGLEAVAPWGFNVRKMATGLRTVPSEMLAFQSAYERFGDPNAMMAGAMRARTDITSQAYLSSMMLGVQPGSTVDTARQTFHAAYALAQRTPTGLLGPMYQMYGLESQGLAYEDFVRMQSGIAPGELGKQEQKFVTRAGKFAPLDKASGALADLDEQVRATGVSMSVGLANAIKDSIVDFTTLSKTLMGMSDRLQPTSELISGLDALAKLVNQAAGQYGSPTFPGPGSTVMPAIPPGLPVPGGLGGPGMGPGMAASAAFMRAAGIVTRTAEGGAAGYGADNPATHATGAYQVMPSNIGPWTQKYYGQALTREQFRANQAAQDAVFAGEFGRYVQSYGIVGALRAWRAGEGYARTAITDPAKAGLSEAQLQLDVGRRLQMLEKQGVIVITPGALDMITVTNQGRN